MRELSEIRDDINLHRELLESLDSEYLEAEKKAEEDINRLVTICEIRSLMIEGSGHLFENIQPCTYINNYKRKYWKLHQVPDILATIGAMYLDRARDMSAQIYSSPPI